MDDDCPLCADLDDACEKCAREIHQSWHERGLWWIRMESCDESCQLHEETVRRRAHWERLRQAGQVGQDARKRAQDAFLRRRNAAGFEEKC